MNSELHCTHAEHYSPDAFPRSIIAHTYSRNHSLNTTHETSQKPCSSTHTHMTSNLYKGRAYALNRLYLVTTCHLPVLGHSIETEHILAIYILSRRQAQCTHPSVLLCICEVNLSSKQTVAMSPYLHLKFTWQQLCVPAPAEIKCMNVLWSTDLQYIKKAGLYPGPGVPAGIEQLILGGTRLRLVIVLPPCCQWQRH